MVVVLVVLPRIPLLGPSMEIMISRRADGGMRAWIPPPTRASSYFCIIFFPDGCLSLLLFIRLARLWPSLETPAEHGLLCR